MTKALEKIVSSVKSVGRKLLTSAATVPFFLGAYATDAKEPNIHQSSSYTFYTQGKNVTNLNTQIPAQKGISNILECEQIKNHLKYEELTSPPRKHQEIEIEIERNGDELKIQTSNNTNRSNLSTRIPISQQIYQEDPNNTHIYLIVPEDLTLSREIQSLSYINEREETGNLLACHPEDTSLAKVLMYFNAGVEGSISSNQKVSPSEVEEAFDNVTDMIPGKTGKGIKLVKDAIVWGIKKAEEKRLDALNKKYGSGYVVHKIPTLVPEGIDLTYLHLGRTTRIKFDESELTEPQKMFIEIPQITYEQNVSGAIRKASLEELVFEITIGPDEKDKSTSSQLPPRTEYPIETLYGEWVGIMNEDAKVTLTKEGCTKSKGDELKNLGNIKNPSTRNRYIIGLRGEGYIHIMSPDLMLHQGTAYKKRNSTEEKVLSLDWAAGRWKAIGRNIGRNLGLPQSYDDKTKIGTSDEDEVYDRFPEIMINNKRVYFRGILRRDALIEVLKKTKIGTSYILKNERYAIIVTPNNDKTMNISTGGIFGTYKKNNPKPRH